MWRLGFAARHDGLTNLRMARGVVKSLPATLAISRVPVTAALRNDDNVNGPCGKNTAAASARVMTSSSPHWAGPGRAFARASLPALRLGMLNAVLMSSRDRASASSTCTRNLLFGKPDALAVRQSAASECKSDDRGLLVSGSEVRALARPSSGPWIARYRHEAEHCVCGGFFERLRH